MPVTPCVTPPDYLPRYPTVVLTSICRVGDAGPAVPAEGDTSRQSHLFHLAARPDAGDARCGKGSNASLRFWYASLDIYCQSDASLKPIINGVTHANRSLGAQVRGSRLRWTGWPLPLIRSSHSTATPPTSGSACHDSVPWLPTTRRVSAWTG